MEPKSIIEKNIDDYKLDFNRINDIVIYEIPFPGYDPSNVDISLEDQLLIIIGKRIDLFNNQINLKFSKYLKVNEYVTASWNFGLLTLNIITKTNKGK